MIVLTLCRDILRNFPELKNLKKINTLNTTDCNTILAKFFLGVVFNIS